MKRGLYWFKNNLRIQDNPSLNHALQGFDELILLYVLDTGLLEKEKLGFERLGLHRKSFLFGSVNSLAADLAEKNLELTILKGNPVEVILQLCEKNKIDEIVTSREPGYFETQWDQELSLHLPVTSFDDQSLIPELPFEYNRLPMGFTSFRKKIEKNLNVRLPESSSFTGNRIISVENSINLEAIHSSRDERTAFPNQPGESSAWERVNKYLWKDHSISKYKKTRNGLIGAGYSSKFSPFLAVGSISAVSIFHEIKKYESEYVSNESTYWLVFELLWREYFRHIGFKFGSGIFHYQGINENTIKHLNNSKADFDKWCKGETEDDFVNANMKELNATGFMSNRGRQNAASYLIHDLGMDWRWGASYFESRLIDNDTTSNWCNWMYIAGVGTTREAHIFDTQRQAFIYDRNKKYQKLWNKD